MTPIVLTIAGSDSGGGAGIQADLAAFHALGAWGACAVTCVTAQSPDRVSRVDPVDPGMVAEQIAVVCDRLGVTAVKIGMTYSAPLIEAIADALVAHAAGIPVVLDPVMRATSGAGLLQPGGEDRLIARLLPLAAIVTPNLAEASVLAGIGEISTLAGMELAARRIADRTPATVVVKGGHLDGSATDVVLRDGKIEHLSSARVDAGSTHGTGCSFSAATAAALAGGSSTMAALQAAKRYVTTILQRPATLAADGLQGLGLVHPGGTLRLR